MTTHPLTSPPTNPTGSENRLQRSTAPISTSPSSSTMNPLPAPSYHPQTPQQALTTPPSQPQPSQPPPRTHAGPMSIRRLPSPPPHILPDCLLTEQTMFHEDSDSDIVITSSEPHVQEMEQEQGQGQKQEQEELSTKLGNR